MMNFVNPSVEVWSMQGLVSKVESHIFYEHTKDQLSDHLGAVWNTLHREVERDWKTKEVWRKVS